MAGIVVAVDPGETRRRLGWFWGEVGGWHPPQSSPTHRFLQVRVKVVHTLSPGSFSQKSMIFCALHVRQLTGTAKCNFIPKGKKSIPFPFAFSRFCELSKRKSCEDSVVYHHYQQHHRHHHHHHYHQHQGVVFPPVKASQLAGASIAFITAPGNAFQGPISFADKLSISAAELLPIRKAKSILIYKCESGSYKWSIHFPLTVPAVLQSPKLFVAKGFCGLI